MANIGQQFKLNFLTGTRFDTIRRVDQDGTVHGDFIEAPADSCRLKQAQPEHLKKKEAQA